MATEEATRRAAELRAQIADHNYRYHVLVPLIVPDAAYDVVARDLTALDDHLPELVSHA